MIALILDVASPAVRRATEDLVLVLTGGPYVNRLVCAVLAPLDAPYLMPPIRSAFAASGYYEVPCQAAGDASDNYARRCDIAV